MNSTSDAIEGAGTLKLNSMPDPAGLQSSVLVHRTWEDALRHLCDHVLTSPECNAWAVVAPDYPRVCARPLARERGMRSGRIRGFPRGGCEEREKQTREASWSNAERLYFRVVRPRIQFIKK